MWKKEVFDQEYSKYYERGIINPREFYKIFYLFLKIGQVLDGPIPIYTYIITAIIILAIFIALCLLSLSFYHGLDSFDIALLTEAGTYILVLSYNYLIMACARLHRADYHKMQRAMHEDFLFFSARGRKYRRNFFLHQLETRKIYNLSAIFTCGVGVGMNLFAMSFLLLHLLTHEPGEGARPLLFPFWYFDTDFSKTPIYEIAFVFSGFCAIAYTSYYTFMSGTEIVWMRYISCKADIVIWHIKDVMDGIRPTYNKGEKEAFENLIRQRMKELIQNYNKMDILIVQYARVHKKFMMFEQIISSPVVCCCIYSVAEKLDEGEFHAILVLLLLASVIMLFLPSYLCTVISEKVSSISHACWDVPFWNAGPVIRPYLVLIIQKSLRPLPLKVAGFQEFSVQTFSNKMASAYSFFNMLRQANK